MKNVEFYRWIQGFNQLCPDSDLSLQRMYIVRNHLNLVAAVEGSLGEYNRQLYRLSEVVAVAETEIEKKAALTEMHVYMHATYTGDNLA